MLTEIDRFRPLPAMNVAIVGGGICGLSLALHLKQRGIGSRL